MPHHRLRSFAAEDRDAGLPPASACAAPAAGADGAAPVEGKGHATTSAGLPIAFEVSGGQVVDVRCRFRWGFCGSLESALGGSASIEPGGHWRYADSRGPFAEATFAAPDRAEGTVVAPSRQLPGCPDQAARRQPPHDRPRPRRPRQALRPPLAGLQGADRPRTLGELTEQGAHRVYLELRYTVEGPVPRGFSRHGSRFLG